MAVYRYSDLNSAAGQIRIVRLLPGLLSDRIKVGIVTAHLSSEDVEIVPCQDREDIQTTLPANWTVHTGIEDPAHQSFVDETIQEFERRRKETRQSFEALSYVWGNPKEQETILVQEISNTETTDESAFCSFEITSSLAGALKHLRNEVTSRDLWIDAICINQSNDEEKSHQITRLRDIFSLARRVIIWLGKRYDESDLALSTLEEIGKDMELLDDFIVWNPTQSNQQWAPLPRNEVPSLSSRQWRALYALFSRPWFTRVWVMQEAAVADLSSVVQCGYDIIPWHVFRRSIYLLLCGQIFTEGDHSVREDLYRKLVDAGNITNQSRVGNFLQVITAGRRKLASDPRDKIYGILGLSPRWFVEAVRPDYKNSLLEVYKSGFIAYIEGTGDLDILLYCDISKKLGGGPSWVPDLNARSLTLSKGSTYSEDKCYATPSFLPSNELKVHGVFCGDVIDVSRPLVFPPIDFGLAVKDFEKRHLKDSGFVGGRIVKLMLTLARGFIDERWPQRRDPSIGLLQELYQKEDYEEMLRQMEPRVPRDTVLIATSTGDIGLANLSAKTEDKIYFLVGCSKPLLFRQNSPGHFEVVGDCYVEETENEQVLLGILPSHFIAQTASDVNGRRIKQYKNVSTSEVTLEDPRTSKLLDAWTLQEDRKGSKCWHYWKTRKGQAIKRGVRMTHEALTARGIQLETIVVV